MAIEANRQQARASSNCAQLDVILPAQHFGPQRKQAPEQRLMIAVLHDALDCLQKYRFAMNGRDQRLFREAQEWFLAEELDWPYSFECICGVLDLDSSAVRQRLRTAPDPQPVPGFSPGPSRNKRLENVEGETMSVGSPKSNAHVVSFDGNTSGRSGNRAAPPLGLSLVTIHATQQMAEMEGILRLAGNHTGQMEALSTLRLWQVDPRLDSGSRQRASDLVWKFQPNGWDEV